MTNRTAIAAAVMAAAALTTPTIAHAAPATPAVVHYVADATSVGNAASNAATNVGNAASDASTNVGNAASDASTNVGNASSNASTAITNETREHDDEGEHEDMEWLWWLLPLVALGALAWWLLSRRRTDGTHAVATDRRVVVDDRNRVAGATTERKVINTTSDRDGIPATIETRDESGRVVERDHRTL